MQKTDLKFILVVSLLMSSCALNNKGDTEMHAVTDINYKLANSSEVFVTSESGDKIARKENVSFKQGYGQGNLIVIRPDMVKQTIDGIGSSFTESSAFFSVRHSRSSGNAWMALSHNTRSVSMSIPLRAFSTFM